MHLKGTPPALVLSASDLSSFVGCRHRTALDLGVALGELAKPTVLSLHAQDLRDRGAEHERGYVASLEARGLRVVDLQNEGNRVGATVEALRQGVDVVVQGELLADGWFGRPDILRRVERPSDLGPWSYEVYDTKLARDTRGSTILQLTVYSELLGRVQGRMPTAFHVVTPDPDNGVHAFRVDDYSAYYRLAKHRLAQCLPDVASHGASSQPSPLHQSLADAHYPEPTDQCDYCRWADRCEARRRADDHLSYIAGASRVQRAELVARDVDTLAKAATMALPIAFRPTRGSKGTYVRLREQARVQLAQRETGRPVWELLDAPAPASEPAEPTRGSEHTPDALAQPRQGLERMPVPSPGDVFLDLEAARFAREGGREYLFGVWTRGSYRCWWATTDAEERAAFEAVVDLVMAAWEADPGVHVYHFGHYEASAFRRLAGRHATRADALDRLLRAGRFIDLHAVVRQSIRAGVESYSIKQLEQYYGYRREADLRGVARSLHLVELALESGGAEAITPGLRQAVETYNADDCRSTEALRDWLEGPVRAQALARGDVLTRPEPSDGAPNDDTRDVDAAVEALRARLLAGIDGDPSDPAHPRHTRWMLAYLIDWHRREQKAAWWDYFRVRELVGEAALEEPCVVSGLAHVRRLGSFISPKTGKPTSSVIEQYSYPPQDIEVSAGDTLTVLEGRTYGEVVEHDRIRRTIDLKVGKTAAELPRPDSLYATEIVRTDVLQAAVMRLAAEPDASTCGLELLYRREPRVRGAARASAPAAVQGPAALVRPGESAVDGAIRLVGQLDRSYLAIQGPPGSGKTYAGARMILALVKAGKRVGVTAGSHKVIVNLLEAVRKQAVEDGVHVTLGRKCKDDEAPGEGITGYGANGKAIEALQSGDIDVLGGTAWLWASNEATASVDVLFVDEAGQMSLANVLAVSQATDSLVLLGDPQQLEQPQKGSHPDGVDVSALQHVIGGAQTMPPERGIFLPETWRLAPPICRFTSEVFYEGKLTERPDLSRQRLAGAAPFEGAGLWFVPVEHAGNHNASLEEVEIVAGLVARLLTPRSQWVDKHGDVHRLRSADLRVVSPYNVQVSRLAERLADLGVPVGTVDKFQGQEAPVVIYSMATSRPEDAPRGMEFLYSLNRLNVATSRARCAAIIVASPALFEPECRTPRQMQLANALCRFRELAVGLTSL
ncbi:hypothetical protein TBR22_A05910 [Luteitalea sp. TBR-22]|uniref:TM0106 family RecB-like putative nuclease n=1 Tax=Luteitalea sp. TBR-22 TaxID=2802971 RepID=UPI001AF5811E|nr:TM0106 family RecB-like putative nuclease [Luteitalea sp. TBR-22]BCS31390.1 hypothetical protein TBR22_A05910 [Luteitalea sp. TBR-22]